MGGGKHRRQNPHGSPGGRKLPGDVLAEKVHGRRGMHDERREKGESRTALLSERAVESVILDDDEFQILYLLHVRGKYGPPGLGWDDLVRELRVIGVARDDGKADDFIRPLVDKTRGWLTYVPYHSVHLNSAHRQAIGEFVSKCLQAKKESSA